VSGIATFSGDTALSEIEHEAQGRGFSLGLTAAVPELTLGDFVAQGLPGMPDPFADPVRGYVCGIEARGALASFRLLPAPRRATGPDLSMLCIGARGEIARVEQASLALVRSSGHAPSSAPAPESLSADESAAWRRVVGGFTSPG